MDDENRSSNEEITPILEPLPAPIVTRVPALFGEAGTSAWERVIEFFTARLRNPNTRMAYLHAVKRFAGWCQFRGIGLSDLTPYLIAAYLENLQQQLSLPSVKQHLSALRSLFDYLVITQILPTNPAHSVRGPRYVVKKGLTPYLAPDEARQLFESIGTSTLSGLRDRALLGVMVYSFARVSAVVAMDREDYFPQGKRYWFRLHEKGGKLHDVPAHHKAEEYMDAYLQIASLDAGKHVSLFQTLSQSGNLTGRRMGRRDVLDMIKRRAKQSGLITAVCCHTFRATGITAFLLGGGTLEMAQRIANHESPRTTKLYDRTSDTISLDEIERIVL